jgi:Mobilization protein NikA
MKTRKKRGRPKLPAGQAKGLTIRFLVSKKEKAEIEAAARRENRTVSNWLRNATLEAARAAPDQGSHPDPDAHPS